ncbi:MAG: GNAT family N-acetyltransferase [Armatimonadota bacterium]
MQVDLLFARENDLPVVLNLSRYYIYDMSEFMGWPCPENGVFGGCDDYFADWPAGRNIPFIIRVDGELAGFTGVIFREVEQAHAVQEFFVMRKFRRRRVGWQVAVKLFDRYHGSWVVEQLVENLPAVDFWRTVVNDYTNGQYTEMRYPSQWGEMNVLRFRNSE